MAWTKRTLPGGALPFGVYGGNGRWLVMDVNTSNIILTDDFTAFTTVTAATVGASFPTHAAKGASRWYLLDDPGTGGFYRSTDGLTGSTWERINCNFRGGVETGWPFDAGHKIAVLPSGRLVVVMRTASDFYGIATSDDEGVTWTERHTTATAWTTAIANVPQIIGINGKVYAVIGGVLLSSSDAGVTWSTVSTPIPVLGFSAFPNGTIAISGNGDYLLRTSTNDGTSWISTANDFNVFYGGSSGAAGYMLGVPAAGGPPQLFYNEGAGWFSFATTGVNADVTAVTPPHISFAAANDLVVFGTGRQPNHAGIYVGEGRFVHAPSTGGTVRLDRLDNRYWAAQPTAFRRP